MEYDDNMTKRTPQINVIINVIMYPWWPKSFPNIMSSVSFQDYYCNNHIRSILIEDDRITACGTGADTPREYYLDVSTVLYYNYLILNLFVLFYIYRVGEWEGVQYS